MASKNSCIVTVALLTLLGVEMIFGAKILFIPINMYSHVLYFSRLAADLAQLGHVTRVLAPSSARIPEFVKNLENGGGNFSYTTYRVSGKEPFAECRNTSEAIMRMALSQSVWEKFRIATSLMKGFQKHSESDCVHLLDNDQLMKQV